MWRKSRSEVRCEVVLGAGAGRRTVGSRSTAVSADVVDVLARNALARVPLDVTRR
jgi:hypothetical protein